MTRHQSRCPWSAAPSACSAIRRSTVSRRKSPCVGEQHVAGEVAQIAAEPARERDAEARLPAPCHLRRQEVGERASQRLLSLPPLQLQRVGQREAELEHLVVEQRRAQLERVGHRGDVGLQQQVAGQVGGDVERAGARRLRAPAEGRSSHVGRASHVPELGPQPGGKDLHQAAVALRGRRGGDVEEARRAEERGARARRARPGARARRGRASPPGAAPLGRRGASPRSARSPRTTRRRRRRSAPPSRGRRAASQTRKSGSAASSPSGSSNASARRGSTFAASGSSTTSSCRVP